MLLGPAGLEPTRSWTNPAAEWHTQAEIVSWARTHTGLVIIQSRYSTLLRQLEAIGLTERDDTRRRYRIVPAVAAALATRRQCRPRSTRLELRLRRALAMQSRREQWLELPAPIAVGAREISRLPRIGQGEILGIALSYAELVWPMGEGRVIWLDEGRTDVMKDVAALERLGLGARTFGEGRRPDLMLLTRDARTGRELLVVAEACASQGAITRTRERQLRAFLAGLRQDVLVQFVTLVLHEECLNDWRDDLAEESWVWLAERLTTSAPVLIPVAQLAERAR